MTATIPSRVLVAGIGNIFFGDDAFGVEVARKLDARPLPSHVRVMDVGIRSLHLAFELAASEVESVILVDVISRGGRPGTLYVIQPGELTADVVPDAHGVQPDQLIALTRAIGGRVPRVQIVGCEPASLEEGMGMTEAVAGAVDAAVALILELVTEPLSSPVA
jgi:hydrogenase maturation protease